MENPGDEVFNDWESQEVDAVITWVDGADRYHREKREKAAREKFSNELLYIPSGKGEQRFQDNNEIEYCVKSIKKFMPWIRSIFIVTDKQIPRFISKSTAIYDNVHIVDHSEVFRGFEWALPTFNSQSIETVIYRIPGLAPKYIYFNDDVIVLRHVHQNEFFQGSNVVLRGRWRSYKDYGIIKTALSAVVLKLFSYAEQKDRSAHLVPQMRAAKLAGFDNRYFHCAHSPHPIIAETLENYFLDHENEFMENIKHKFRHLNQFVAHPLAHHLQIAMNSYKLCEKQDHLTLSFADPVRLENDLQFLRLDTTKFVCLQSLELATPEMQRQVIGFIQERLGN